MLTQAEVRRYSKGGYIELEPDQGEFFSVLRRAREGWGPKQPAVRRLKRGLDTGFEVVVTNAPTASVQDPSKRWILYFDGLPITNMSPRLPDLAAMNPADRARENGAPVTIFQFEFSHDSAGQTWRELFAQAGFFRESAITIGFPSGPIGITPEYVAFKSLMIPWARLGIAGGVYLVVLCYAVFLSFWRGMLKEDDGRGVRVFSLGRTQMAFWFFVVLGAYLFIGVMTGRWVGIIGTQALALMGISATTGVAAAAISKEKRGEIASAPAVEASLKAQEALLQDAIKDPANSSNVPVLTEQLKAAAIERARVVAQRVASGIGTVKGVRFWRDLVSDADGIALHRFQVVIWTVVLGIVFIIRVATDLVMPELDPTTLTLMGISSGTYLGFKLPEKA